MPTHSALFESSQDQFPHEQDETPDETPDETLLDDLCETFGNESKSSRSQNFALAFLFSQLSLMAKQEAAISIRRLALQTLCALIRVLDPPLLAAFLPGLVSTCISILARSPRLHSTLALPALKTLHHLIFRTFPYRQPTLPRPPAADSMASALHALSLTPRTQRLQADAQTDSSTEPAAPHPHNAQRECALRVIINKDWCDSTARNLRPYLAVLVVSKTGPRTHTLPSVRLAFSDFLSTILQSRHSVLDDFHAALFKFALLEACNHVIAAVSDNARRSVVRLARTGVLPFERAVVAVLRSVPSSRVEDFASPSLEIDLRALRKLSTSSDEGFVMNLCAGILSVLVPVSNMDHSSSKQFVDDECIIESGRLSAFFHRVGIVPFAHMLLCLHEHNWRPGSVDVNIVSELLRNDVLVTAVHMGRLGLLSCIYEPLLQLARPPDPESGTLDSGLTVAGAQSTDGPDRDLTSFKPRAHAALLLHAAVNGAMKLNIISDGGRLAVPTHIGRCAKEIVEVVSCLFVPSTDQATVREVFEVDDTVLTLKMALLQALSSVLNEMVHFHQRYCMRPLGSDVLLLFLMNLLRDVAHGEPVLRSPARDTFSFVAKTFRCESDRALLLRHLNFIVGRVIRNLHERWAGDVLHFVIGCEGDNVSREATSLLQRTLKDLGDSLAGAGDADALRMLRSMTSVLVTASAQIDHGDIAEKSDVKLPCDNSDQSDRCNFDEENAVVHRSLMYYCIDDVEEGDEPRPQTTKVGNEDLFEGFGEEGDEDWKVAFEDVAASALDGARDLLVARSWRVRASALECATLAVRLLKGRKKVLLPHAAKLLPLIPEQFSCMIETLNAGERLFRAMKERKAARKGRDSDIDDLVIFVNAKGGELPVVRHACLLLSALAECAGSFIRERFVRLIFPKMRSLLRLCASFPTLLSRVADGNVPSHGAMAACDACLEAVACIASQTPIALAPHASVLTSTVAVFFDERFNPESGIYRDIVHVNRRMVMLEKERWNLRVACAERIVRGIAAVQEDEVFCSLLCMDDGGDSRVRSGKSQLFDVIVR